MATVTGLTAARMLAIEAESVTGGTITGGHLILETFGGSEIDAGVVVGPEGPPGPPGGLLPGEIRMWSGLVVPDISYGHWVWADGASYAIDSHPLAAANIADAWRTFDGAADPGGTNFRVPDMRGLVAAGLDAMPFGSRKNRVTRGAAIVLADLTGEENHQLSIDELASHRHPFHKQNLSLDTGATAYPFFVRDATDGDGDYLGDNGDDQPHENMQPTVFIPYIVFLDDSGV